MDYLALLLLLDLQRERERERERKKKVSERKGLREWVRECTVI
jgi:hypothetical protein